MPAHFVSKNLRRFSLAKILKEINSANEKTSCRFQDSFSKDERRFLSHYAYSLGFLSGPLTASTDGTLFPTFSRFMRCDYFEKRCQRIQITGLLSRIKGRVNKLLNHPEKIVLGKSIRLEQDVPLTFFPSGKRGP